VPHGSEDRNDQFDVAYKYIGDKSAGTFTFNAPSKPGNYDMRFNDTDDHGTEIASVSFTVTTGAAALSLSKTNFEGGEKIIVTFNTPDKLDPKAWIGIIPSDIPHGSEDRNDQFDVAYKYLAGKSSGTLEFIAPTKVGAYDFRLNDTDNHGNELASVSFTVSTATASVSLNKSVYDRGERIWVTFKTSVPFETNAWLGVIPSEIPHGSEEVNDQHDVSYVYVKGESEGVKELAAPTTPGSYDIRLNDSDDKGKEIASVTFTVR
jgi:hypothetical protein